MRSAAPQKLRSGKALRKSDMNALMSAWPLRGSCSEYCRSMSGAASSSTMPRLHVSPQKSVNQRPTMALLSLTLDMIDLLARGCGSGPPPLSREVGPDRYVDGAGVRRTPVLALVLKANAGCLPPPVIKPGKL